MKRNIIYFVLAFIMFISLTGCKKEHEHDFKVHQKVEATCTAQGYTTYKCECGESKTENYVNPLGHLITHYEKLDATCTTDGYNAYDKCSRCDYTTYSKIPATGHTHVPTVTNPTCTNQGYTTYKCSCGDTYVSDYVDVIDHTYTSIITEPTCTLQGYTTYKCSCGDNYIDDYVDALDHNFVHYEGADPKCEEDGYYAYDECSRCGHSNIVVIPATGHDYESVITEPTCTQQGYTTYKCHCGHNYVDEYVNALDHDYIYHDAKEPTCTEPGHNSYNECSRCEYTTYEVIESKGHDYVNYVCTKCNYEINIENLFELNDEQTEIEFGSYPQTLVTDTVLKSALDQKIGGKPTATNPLAWTAYGYYYGNDKQVTTNDRVEFMWYQDIYHEGETYRAVYFNKYRPNITSQKPEYKTSHQDDNGYYTYTVYYFRFDPIKWKVLTLDSDSNKAFLVADLALDSQEINYNPNPQTIDGKKIYPNNYEYSTIRSWLNDNFLNAAFTQEEQTIIMQTMVDNSVSTTNDSRNNYTCNDTFDKIFLLSYSDLINPKYGFADTNDAIDINRRKEPTDYALAQSAIRFGEGELSYYVNWWLRSPNYTEYTTSIVYYDGSVTRPEYPNGSYMGVVPALWVYLGEETHIHDFTEATCITPKQCKTCSESFGGLADHNYVDGVCTGCNGKQIYIMNESKTQVVFGSYPQSLVTDETIKSSLNSMVGTLPDFFNNYTWTSYGYYIQNSTSKNFMWYQDIELDNVKYRAVYFTDYRPYWTGNISEAGSSYQDEHGYYKRNVYFFRYDPIVWRVLGIDNINNKAFLMADIALDSQEFNYTQNSHTDENGNTIYGNNYEYSTIRAWLNDNFYNLAFTEEEKQLILTTLVDNSIDSTYSTDSAINMYVCNDTYDKIFLLSHKEVKTMDYGQGDVEKRTLTSSDYAKCQGGYINSYNKDKSRWWLRSPSSYSGKNGMMVDIGSNIDSRGVAYTDNFVVPALWLSLE